VYTIRAVTNATEVTTALTELQPHLALLDMDLDDAQILALLGAPWDMMKRGAARISGRRLFAVFITLGRTAAIGMLDQTGPSSARTMHLGSPTPKRWKHPWRTLAEP
jgi:hypothetical protein